MKFFLELEVHLLYQAQSGLLQNRSLQELPGSFLGYASHLGMGITIASHFRILLLGVHMSLDRPPTTLTCAF